jgi:phosphatidylglycerol---prolipoprotein diacylglyceryl transferase
VHPLLFHFGHIAIPTYGACTALALLSALALSMLTAKRAGLDPEKVWNLELIAILTALIAARLLMILFHPRMFGKHPFWLLGLVTLPSIWAALGGVLVAVLAAILYALAEGLPQLRTADVLAPPVALAFCLNRIGAFCGGSAWGTPTHIPWGVIYRSPVAYLWYRVPLGVPLHPVQLYDAAVSLVLFVLLLWLGRRTRTSRDGDIAGAWLFLYGLSRFFLEFLRGDPARHPLLGGAVTLAQLMAMVAVVAGGVLWMRRKPATGTTFTQP